MIFPKFPHLRQKTAQHVNRNTDLQNTVPTTHAWESCGNQPCDIKPSVSIPPGMWPQPPVFSNNSIFHEQKEFTFLPEPSEPTWTIMAHTRISLQELEFGQRENQAFGPLMSEPHFKERLGTHMAIPHWVAKTKCYRRMTERGAGHGNPREGEQKTFWNWREGIKGRKPCVAGRGETAGDCC